MTLALAGWLALALSAQVTPDVDALPRHLSLDEPRAAAVQDPKQDRFPPSEPHPAAQESRPFVDFDWLELTPSAGLAVYSSKFLSDPGLALSVRAHAPLPWLSPAGDVVKEYFGVFFQTEFASIDRDMSHTVSHRKGMASLFSVGPDYTIIRDSTWVLVARAGIAYVYYGGIADLKNGVGPIAGLTAGVQITSGIAIAYNPEVILGDTGSHIFVNTIGVLIQF